MIVLDLSILNQKGTPMFNSDIFANRPAFGIVGRIFISIDTAAIYRDTGTAWDLIADGGSASTNIYNSNGTLSANRVVSSGGFSLTFNPSTTFDTTLTAASNTSSLAIFGVNRLSYASGFSSNNIGNLFGGSSSFNLQTFAGSATFANSNIAANSSINSVDFSTGGSTITMTQATGLRVMAGHINMFQYQGTNSGTITHAAVSQNLGFYRPPAATGILTITNAYGYLINDLNDYGAGFTFTNRWGIYQAGASDTNYFAANVLIGTTVNSGFKLNVNGTLNINLAATIGGSITTNSGGLILGTGSGANWQIYKEPTNSFLGFYISGPIPFMSLSNTGNLLVGTTTDAGQKLQVNGSSYLNGDVNLANYGSIPTIIVPSGTASVINTNGGTILNYFSTLPAPYTQDIQIDITFVNWGGNPVVALVDLMATLREFGGTSGLAFGKIFANSPATTTFTSFDTSNITTSQCSLTASSGGNYILRITINPSSVVDRIGIYLNIQYGGIGSGTTNISISYI